LRDTVLLVRHGPGRGRIEGYCNHVLDWLGAERPELSARVRLHETGTGPAALDDISAVFFWLADPLLDYPDCYEEAIAIQEEAERRSLPMINRPTALATYGKDFQAERFLTEDIPTPRAVSVDSVTDLADCIDRLGLPLLVRGARSFSRQGTLIVRSRHQVDSLKQDDLPEHAIVTGLVDVKGPQAGYPTHDLWSRYYHRKRVLLIGDQCVPDSLYLGKDPLLQQSSSLYRDFHSWQTRLRPYGWFGRQAIRVVRRRMGLLRAVELETEFTEAPVDADDLFKKAGAALGLEFLAFDYASLPDGSLLIWEANPYPHIPSTAGNILPHTRGVEPKVRNIYRAFARCFESLLAAAPHS
jgi:hypothetical protein